MQCLILAAINATEKLGLVALLGLSPWCLVIVVWLFVVVPWVCLQIVIVVFPDHTHLLFFMLIIDRRAGESLKVTRVCVECRSRSSCQCVL